MKKSFWGKRKNLFANNLSFGFLPSESAKIFEEFDSLFSRKIAKGSIFEKKRNQNCKKITDSEWIKPKTEVNKQKTNLDLCNTLLGNSQNYLACDLTKKEARVQVLNFINDNFSLVKKDPDLFSFLQKDETVFLNIPMDEETPEKRLLRPQAFIQENLLRRYVSTFCYRMDLVKARSQDELIKLSEKDRFLKILRSLKKDSNLQLLITDSQAIDIVHNWTLNENIAITTFSIVMAHVMSNGRLRLFEKGIQAFKNLKKGDSILIAEACNHNRMAEDIGTVQIPNKIEALFGKGSIQVDHAFGREFSQKDLKKYKLIIHCGGCMIDKQKMNARIEDLIESEIPLTNYGMILSYLHSADSLNRVLGPFL
ncbi:MAG: hypothetical protein HZB76_06770 [Chlamydiae bacterium]|nr:hypothetical protein [Chlamydiota bacterium]